MNEAPTPYFTEEFSLFYLWRPAPAANKLQLAGEFKSEKELQAHSAAIFGVPAVKRVIDQRR